MDEWIDDYSFDRKDLKKIKIEDLLEREIIKVDYKKIEKEINSKTVLVTGAAGSIGSEITFQLKFNPKLIILIDIAETPLHNLKLTLQDKKIINLNNVKFYSVSITNYSEISEIFTKYKPEIIYHAAAFKHVPLMESNPKTAVINNIIGTYNLLELSQNKSTYKFVFVSTDKAVNPTNVMGATKIFRVTSSVFLRLED